MKKCHSVFFILIIFLLLSPNMVQAIGISTAYDWIKTITESDLIAGAGSDLNSTYESAANQSTLGVTNSSGSWTITIFRTDTTWDAALTISAHRTGDGTGSGSITGGTTYQAITTSAVTFFTGTLVRSTIPVQWKLTGMSLTITPRPAPDKWFTKVTLTVSGS